MLMAKSRLEKRGSCERRKRCVRAKVFRTPERPRLAVLHKPCEAFVHSLLTTSGRTLCSASALDRVPFYWRGGASKEAANSRR